MKGGGTERTVTRMGRKAGEYKAAAEGNRSF
jgi:hypothetical protein